MPKSKGKFSAETVAIVQAIESATSTAKIVADTVARELSEHTTHDDERFDRLTKLVESIATDTKSLLDSRSFIKGAWWTIVKIATAAAMGSGAIITLINYLRGH
jgi:hypothetical protein